MARVRPAPTPTPDQLTLDGWAEMMKADRQTTEALHERSFDAPALRAAAGHTSDVGDPDAQPPIDRAAPHHLAATNLLAMPEGLLTRTRLRELGLERRAVDAVFRALPVVALPGYTRPMVRVDDYLELVERHTFRDDRVRPSARVS
jgi:hypothetical protein